MYQGRTRILLIEDNPGDARLIREMLVDAREANLRLEWVDCLATALAFLSVNSVDVVLVDLALPDSQGLDAFRQIQNSKPGMPIVVMTGLDDEDLPLTALREGAQDYLVKGQVDGPLLVRALRYAIERKRTEEELRKQAHLLRASEERFRLIAENALDLIYRYRVVPTPGFDYVSPSITAMTGYTPQDCYADPGLALRIVHPEDRHYLIAAQQSPARLKARMHTLRLRRKDGTVIWTEERIVPIVDENGYLVAFEGIARDITMRKRVEQERERLLGQLAAEQRWLRTVIDRSPVGIFLIEGANGERVIANRHAEELLGQSSVLEGGVTKCLEQIFRPDGSTHALEESCALRALKGEAISGEERLIRRSDGQSVPVLVSAAPIHNGTGQILGAVVIVEDITPLKELERLREEWTSMVAHDLRQPLTVIAATASLLAEPDDQIPSRGGQRIDHIRNSATRMQRMIGDLLDVSRIGSRRLKLMPRDVDLPSLARETIDRLGTVLRSQRIHLEVTGAIPPISADPQRVEQILANLVSNAAKYGYPEFPIRVAIRLSDQDVQVSVINQGDGIPPNELPNLFSRFRRTRQTERKRIEGIGLGLYIAKGLVESHGGRIWAESTPGATTTFSFTLPLARGTG